MTTTPLNVAIVGSGIIGQVHARVVVAHPDLRLVAVVDSIESQNTALADYVEQELQGERPTAFGSLEKALAKTNIDLVAVCAPSGAHASIAEQALAAGKHVVIEKPLDVRVDRARDLRELADQAAEDGIVVSVISQHRFDPANVAISKAITDGRFGRITSATATIAWWRGQNYFDSGDWRGTWQWDGGGALMNQGVHTVDLLVHFLGTPVEAYGHTGLLAHEGIEVEDIAAAVVRFESGAFATILATTNAHPHVGARVQVHGSTGSAVSNNDQLEFFFAADARPQGASAYVGANQAMQEVSENDVPGGKVDNELFAGHLRQYEDILDAIKTGREPGVTVAEATKALALVRAVYISQTIGAPVSYADVMNGTYDDLVLETGPDAALVGVLAS